MVKFYPVFIFLSLFATSIFYTRAREVKNENTPDPSLAKASNCIDCPNIKERFQVPPVPILKNTGNPEMDSADYAAEKEKWIRDVLSLYEKNFSDEQIQKIREQLRKENLEDVMNGKIVLAE